MTIRACVVRVHRVRADIEFAQDDRIRCLSNDRNNWKKAEEKKRDGKSCTPPHVTNRDRAPYDADVTLLHLNGIWDILRRGHPQITVMMKACMLY